MRKARRWLAAAVLALCTLAGSQMARAQAGSVATVVSIAVDPAPGRTASAYAPLVSQRVGAPLNRLAIRASIQALFRTGDFADIEARAYPAPGGVRLEFVTQPQYFVGVVRVQGGPDVPTVGELQDASGLELGHPYDAALARAGAAQIADRLQNYGYRAATVSYTAQADRTTAQVAVSFTVHCGPMARLGAMSFSGAPLFPAAQLRAAIKLKAGVELPRESLTDAVRRLQSFYGRQGRLDADVSIAGTVYHAATNTLDVDFAIDAGPRVEVRVEGAQISAGDLRRAVPIYQEHASDDVLVEEGRANLLALMQRHGYYEATVTAHRTQPESDLVRILYAINPGPQEEVEAVALTGNRYFSDKELRPLLTVTPATVLPNLVPGARGEFSNPLLAADAKSIGDLYRANGFDGVTVEPSVNRSYRGRPGHIQVIYRIHEGPQTLVRNLTIVGAQAVSPATLENLLTTAPGQPYSSINLALDRDAILTYYANAGFPAADCNSVATPVAGSSRVDVSYTITEGVRQTVNRVYLAGYQDIRPSVIGRQIQVAPGQPLSQSKLLASQRNLFDTGLFTDAAVVAQDPDGQQDSKNVLVAVTEARRYTFQEGVGLQIQPGTGGSQQNVLGTTGYSPLLEFNVTRIGVGGRNQDLEFHSDYGTLQKRGELTYAIPQLLNLDDWKSSLSALYDDTFDVRTYRAITEQATLEFDQALSNVARWSYTIDYRRVRVLDPLVSPDEIPILSRPDLVAGGAATYIRDHRNDALDTQRGNYNTFSLGADKGFGGADFGRVTAQDATYTPLDSSGSVVLARSTQLGFLLPFGQTSLVTTTDPVTGASTSTDEQVIPLPERFLSGGADSLRGFSINQAGPRDPITGFPVGGNALFVNNVELRYPMPFPSIGGVVFYDAGNVYAGLDQLPQALWRWRPPSPTDLDFTSHAVGTGVRYKTPVGPVRLDFSLLLNPPVFQYFNTTVTPAQPVMQQLPRFHFFFSIGQTF